MNIAELRNQALVAAAAAKDNGFDSTYEALLQIVLDLEREKVTQRHVPYSEKIGNSEPSINRHFN